MKFVYKNISKKSESLLKEKGSKFYAYAFPVNSEEEIINELNILKKEHAQATHICYAYKLGLNQIKYRYNDDGEPSNSAGAPIYGQINSFELTNIFIAVVRYYGGTKLGVGGLIQAYRLAAKEAIEKVKIIEITLKSEFTIEFEYVDLPQIMTLLKQEKIEIIHQNSNENCMYTLIIENQKIETFKDSISKIKGVKILKEDIKS
jgi:uncharacterized YigZ family protein